MQLRRYIATGREKGGEVIGRHFQPIPLQTTIEAAREQGPETDLIEATLKAESERRGRLGPRSPPLVRVSSGP